MIVVVDYGMGNLGSILNMFRKLKAEVKISNDPDTVLKAEKLVLPGVGAFDTAMVKINNSKLKEVLDIKALKDKVPIIGICLGMQLLMDRSEEGVLPGLGWISGRAYKFNNSKNIKIPHMGWNSVDIASKGPLTVGFETIIEVRFYFVHSYYVLCKNKQNSMLRTTYDIPFDSAIQKGNIFGVQFHPEKSHKFGMRLFENFIRI